MAEYFNLWVLKTCFGAFLFEHGNYAKKFVCVSRLCVSIVACGQLKTCFGACLFEYGNYVKKLVSVKDHEDLCT